MIVERMVRSKQVDWKGRPENPQTKWPTKGVRIRRPGRAVTMEWQIRTSVIRYGACRYFSFYPRIDAFFLIILPSF